MTAINWSNVTDFGQLPQLANIASNNSFWVGMLYMVWIVVMLMMIFYGFEVAILVSSFLALIIGTFLVYADLVSWTYLMTFVGVILAMFLYIIWSGKKTTN